MPNQHLTAARIFTRMMDSQFSLFGIRFGLDNILGLVPGAGDLLAMLLSFYLIYIGIIMKIPANKLFEMIFNVVADAFIGTIPVAGDIADLFFQANSKNLRILEKFESDGIEGEII